MPRRDDPQPGLGKAIRLTRERNGLSQVALGTRADIHPTWISHIESGRINPTWGNVRRIADGLDLPLGELADAAQLYEKDLLTALRRPALPAPPSPRPPSKLQRRRSRATKPLDVDALVALRDQYE